MDPRTPPTARRRVATTLIRVRRAVLRRRRVLAAGLTAVAAVAALRTVAPPAPATRAVVVAARELPAGVRLQQGDVTTRRVPPGDVPDGVSGSPVGRVLAAPVTRGEPITAPRLVGQHLTDAAPSTTAVPVRISDPGQAALLTVGDRIDLLATDPQHATTERVATGVRVLAVPASGKDVGATGSLSGRLVVLAIPDAYVEDVTADAVVAFVTYAWSTG